MTGAGLLVSLSVVASAPAGVASSAQRAASSAPGVTSDSVTVGILTSLTGPTAPAFTGFTTGFQTLIDLQNAEGGVNGRTIKTVTADDQGTTTGALSAAETLVEQDHAFAIAAESTVTIGAAPYLHTANVPVVGSAIDASEWAPPNNNMFPTFGSPGTKAVVPANFGLFFKREGAKNVAIVGYDAPGATELGQEIQASVKAAGLKSTYLNNTIPFTQTGGFGSIVEAMKQQDADALYIIMTPTANFSLLEATKQADPAVKVIGMDDPPPPGTFSNAEALAAVQGVWVPSRWVPYTLKTPGTKAFQAALTKYSHQTAPPDQNEYDGWAAAAGIIKGLQEAGKSPTVNSFETGLRAVKDFNADGILNPPSNMKTSFGIGVPGVGPYPTLCVYWAQYKKTNLVSDSSPLCGGAVGKPKGS